MWHRLVLEEASPSITGQGTIRWLRKRSVCPAPRGPPQPVDPLRCVRVVEIGKCLDKVEGCVTVSGGTDLDLVRSAFACGQRDSARTVDLLRVRATLRIQN